LTIDKPQSAFVGALLAGAFNLHKVTLTTFCVSKLHAYVEIILKSNYHLEHWGAARFTEKSVNRPEFIGDQFV